MTNEEVDALESGRELDALIHDVVMAGWTTHLTPEETIIAIEHDMIPYYSTNISDAWRVVEVFRRGWSNHAAATINLAVTEDDIDGEDCYCDMGSPDLRDHHGTGKQMPEAICKCALKIANHVQNIPPQ